MGTNQGSWCIVRLGDDYNWWVSESSDDITCDVDAAGILDPKQVEHMSDLLVQLKRYGLNDEIVNNAFVSFQIEKEMPKKMFRLKRIKDDILNPRDGTFCLPNIVDDREGLFSEFIDHIIALRVKLLNASFDFHQPLNSEEIEDILHAEQQERYIAGIKTHAFDEIVSILDYVPDGYTLDNEIDEDDGQSDDLDLSEFNDDVDDESLNIDDEKNW